MVFRITFFIALSLISLCAHTKELTLKSRVGDVRVEEQGQVSIILNLQVNSWNPIVLALYVAGIYDFIDSISEQVVSHFEQINENTHTAPIPQLETDFQSQLQSQFEAYVENYVQRHLLRIYGAVGWMLHSGIFCALLFIHGNK